MFLSPKKIVEYSDVHLGMKVADIGASVGHFAIPLAERVGAHGKVYAIDIQKDLLSKLKKDAKAHGLSNIEVLWADAETPHGLKLHDESVDRVFIVNTLFQVENKESFVSEAKRILKKGGKVILIDWSESFGGAGPHKDSVVNAKKAFEIFDKERFQKESEISAGAHHYGIIFKK